jgi:hypothetical protein
MSSRALKVIVFPKRGAIIGNVMYCAIYDNIPHNYYSLQQNRDHWSQLYKHCPVPTDYSTS